MKNSDKPSNKPERGPSSGGVQHVTAGPEDAGQRIDNFLLRILKGAPRSLVYRIIRKGEVRVNKGRTKPTYKLVEGDVVRVPPVRLGDDAPSKPPPKGAQELLGDRIIHEDDRVIVINKPAGMAVHGGSGLSFGVIEALRALRPDAPFLELVHRLDRETSGCLIVAKKRSALRRLHSLLRGEQGGMEKRYLTLVAGSWSYRREEIRTFQRKIEQGGERMVRVVEPDTPGAKEALSRFKAVDYYPGSTLMQVEIDTGRTHQIRVQAAHVGHPVIGDDKYGNPEANEHFRKLGLKRLFLHAMALSFVWPDSDERFDVSVPMDDDLREVINKLESGGGEAGPGRREGR
ncbi:MAG: RluA family pseudouridine synthase [Gammaproteobacteria bacterium]|nr:RluA family pseudouridine synthase [Gammaproteobacteria bacterium]